MSSPHIILPLGTAAATTKDSESVRPHGGRAEHASGSYADWTGRSPSLRGFDFAAWGRRQLRLDDAEIVHPLLWACLPDEDSLNIAHELASGSVRGSGLLGSGSTLVFEVV